MITILFRTLIIYIALILTMRLMGKRQIGELEVTDLVTTLLISEIASLPITNQEIPVSFAIIPMGILLVLEVCSSWILIKFPKLKGLVSARPTVIIKNSVLDQSALRNSRISIDELMSEIRQQGLTDLSQVEDAILEKDGKLTILPRTDFAPPTVGQLQLKVKGDKLMHIVYSNGTVSKTGLQLIGKTEEWLCRELERRGLDSSSLFCVTANADGQLYWIKQEEKPKP